MIVKAPARICLFGDHQDYLELPVIACAIDKYITVEGKPNYSNFLNFFLLDLKKEFSVDLNDELNNIKKGDHIRYVIKTLKKNSYNINKGYDIKIYSEIFINAGISSSSALTVALLKFFCETFSNRKISNVDLAELAYQSEVIEQGGSGGRMDQYSISLGKTIFLQTGENYSFDRLKSPFNNFIVANSSVKKQTDFLLKNLKAKTLNSINKLRGFNPLFDISKVKISELDYYSEILEKSSFTYFEAAVLNHHITLHAHKELKKSKPDLLKLGKLMNEHHDILKNKLSITVPKIDFMIETARKHGAYGTKIIGSGGGGSILILSEKLHHKKIINELSKIGVNEIIKANESSGILSL